MSMDEIDGLPVRPVQEIGGENLLQHLTRQKQELIGTLRNLLDAEWLIKDQFSGRVFYVNRAREVLAKYPER